MCQSLAFPAAFASFPSSPHVRSVISSSRPSTQLSALPVASQIIPAATNGLRNVLARGTTAISSMLSKSSASFLGVFLAILFGFFMGRLTGQRSGAQRLSNVPLEPGANLLDSTSLTADDEEGVTPLWLNYALARMWALFQKNTRRLVSDVIQPILDDTEKPPFVVAVRLNKFKPGKRSPFLRSLRRLPSRALSEVQYSVNTLFASTSVMEFEVDINPYKDVMVTIPVIMRNLDFDALWWMSLSLAPYDPFLQGVQFALLKPPRISFDMTIYGLVPITAVPVLRSFFFRVITKEIPKAFLFPNTEYIDFRPPEIVNSSISEEDVIPERVEDMKIDQLKELFPEQWALFDALDLDGDNALSPVELFAGLKEWGYSAQDASDSFKLLDVSGDNLISFLEFIENWPTLEGNFVPNRYKGILTVFLKSSSGLPVPLIGVSDPVVRLKLSGQEAVSKRDSRTSTNGERGSPIWNEAFELNCESIRDEELEIIVEEGARFGLRRTGQEIARATVPLNRLSRRKDQNLSVDLKPNGKIHFDMSYAAFLDHQS